MEESPCRRFALFCPSWPDSISLIPVAREATGKGRRRPCHGSSSGALIVSPGRGSGQAVSCRLRPQGQFFINDIELGSYTGTTLTSVFSPYQNGERDVVKRNTVVRKAIVSRRNCKVWPDERASAEAWPSRELVTDNMSRYPAGK